jgi:hypothetical protein
MCCTGVRVTRFQINGRTFMLPVSDFDCLESAGASSSSPACLFPMHNTSSADNALILGDPWFRQFVIFHDLRHHEMTDKTNNVSGVPCFPSCAVTGSRLVS